MKYKEGDRVLFLNEKGGGVVTRVIDEHIVHVSIEDGFEIPCAIGDLIRDVDADEIEEQRAIHHRTNIRSSLQKQSRLNIEAHQTGQMPSGIYLAMVPRNQDQVLASAMDFYILNHTAFHVAFSLFLNKSGHFRGHALAVLDPSEKYHLGKVERSEIEDWNHALLQSIFFREGKTEVPPPLSSHIAFKPMKIYKEESFAFSHALHQKALLVAVHQME